MKCASSPIVIVGMNLHYLLFFAYNSHDLYSSKGTAQGEPAPTSVLSGFSILKLFFVENNIFAMGFHQIQISFVFS
jgi:hypothetical protein